MNVCRHARTQRAGGQGEPSVDSARHCLQRHVYIFFNHSHKKIITD